MAIQNQIAKSKNHLKIAQPLQKQKKTMKIEIKASIGTSEMVLDLLRDMCGYVCLCGYNFLYIGNDYSQFVIWIVCILCPLYVPFSFGKEFIRN